MNNTRQIFCFCIFLAVGWTLLANKSDAQAHSAQLAISCDACQWKTLQIHLGLPVALPLGSWQAEQKTESSSEARLRKRLVLVGIVTSGVIAILGLLFTYLRMEHITRGFYSGRLQMLAIALTIVVVCLCYLAWLKLGH